MNIERISYGGWPNCYRLSNGTVDVVATSDVGPRLVRFGFQNGPNQFKEFSEQLGRVGDAEWNSYGGHRLWLAPEVEPRTYYPDNERVEVAELPGALRLTAPVEVTTRMQKEIEVSLGEGASVFVTHRVTNHGIWAVDLAPWSLSVMAVGGVCVFPLPPRGPHPENLAPSSNLTLWPFTDMSDPRWTWGRKYVMLRQDEALETPQKVGASVPDGWAAYLNANTLFVKRFDFDPDALYPDLNANFETFADADILEVETLGPLHVLEPGETLEHRESWSLHANVPDVKTEADIDAHILPLCR